MSRFLLRRAYQVLVVIIGISIVTFILLRLSGDPAAMLLPESATPQDLRQMRTAMGLDAPLPIQFWIFATRAARGDFGLSTQHREPALALVAARILPTLELTLIALGMALVVAVPLGISAGVRSGSLIDRTVLVLSVLAQSVPIFWVGALLITLFSVDLHWFPSFGRSGPASYILPSVSLALYLFGVIARVLRSSLVEVLREPYVRTAWAKGLTRRAVILRHAIRNAVIPTLTVIGTQFGVLVGGVVITEQVFAYPGMGLLALQAIGNRDFPILQAFVVVVDWPWWAPTY